MSPNQPDSKVKKAKAKGVNSVTLADMAVAMAVLTVFLEDF